MTHTQHVEKCGSHIQGTFDFINKPIVKERQFLFIYIFLLIYQTEISQDTYIIQIDIQVPSNYCKITGHQQLATVMYICFQNL